MTGTGTYKAYLPWLIILGLWAVLHGALAATVAAPVFDGLLPGPDEYMRLVRVAELRDGGGWYDSVIARGNAPYGDTLHWTRPLDLLILPGAAILSVFMSKGDALFAAGAAISPLLGLLTCFAVAWATRPILGRDRSLLAVFVFLIQPAVIAYSAAGRADHHALLFPLFVMVVGGTLRTIGPRPATRDAIVAGASYGLAIWASVELTLLVALCQAAAVIAWIRFDTVKARPQLIAAGAFLVVTLIALLVERPPADILTVEFDRLSIPFAVIAALTVGVWCAASAMENRTPNSGSPRQRILAIGAAGGIGLAMLLALFPGFIAGPFAAVDPRILPIWHAHVAELEPLLPDTLKHTGQFLFFIGGAALSLPYAIVVGWRSRKDAEGFRWIFLAMVITAYFLLSLQHVRVAPFAELASVPLLADMIARLVEWGERNLGTLRRLIVTCAACFILMFGSVLGGSYLLTLSAEASTGEPEPQCRVSKIAELLNDPKGVAGQPQIIAGLLDHGPEILYRTGHSVVSAPYHRNGAGIWDSHELFATADEAESRAIVSRRGIGLLLICPTSKERRFFNYEAGSGNLYSRLIDGDTPAWLSPVAVEPDRMDGFRLYRVAR